MFIIPSYFFSCNCSAIIKSLQDTGFSFPYCFAHACSDVLWPGDFCFVEGESCCLSRDDLRMFPKDRNFVDSLD